LQGVAVLVAGACDTSLRGALAVEVRETCAALGASVSTCAPAIGPDAAGCEAALDLAVAAAASERGGLDLLAVDGAGLYAEGLARSGNGHGALRACMDGAWNATRAVVNQAFLQAEASGRIVYLAPGLGAGEHAPAACAGLENLARTLSTEWARHGITTLTIAPGARTSAEEIATLVAYLASPAGAYFSGCLLDLRGA
jgi:NAD(P)-dependent dehydrogenase (short-subunit alcohol dehydrogenase family)